MKRSRILLAINLLVIPLKLKEDNYKIFSKTFNFAKYIPYPSLLSHLILAEIKNNWQKPDSWDKWHSGRASEKFETSQYFEHYKTAFLPPIYKTFAEKIENQYLIPFQRQWAYEWENIIKRTSLSKSDSPYYFIRYGSRDKNVIIDVPQSEAYRSAFLRALAWAVDQGNIDIHLARNFALECFPIDIAIWKIQNINKPNWWISVSLPQGKLDTIPGQIWKSIDEIWQNQYKLNTNQKLIQAAGSIVKTENLVYDFEIYSAFQSTEGAEIPELENISNWLSSRFTFTNSPKVTLNGHIYTESYQNHIKDYKGWNLIPCSFRLRSNTSMRWLAYWMYRGIWVPAPYLLKENNNIKIKKDSILIEENRKTISKWQVWHDHIEERWNSEIPPGVGEFVLMDNERIKEFCESTKSNFCWIVDVIMQHRRDKYKSFETMKDFRVYGASKIIL